MATIQAGIHTVNPSDRLHMIVVEHYDAFRPGFLAWLCEPVNRSLWSRFAQQADRLWDRGRRHYSARTIVEFLRHETLAADTSAEFKINGNIVPDLARLYHFANPERVLFETRVQRESGRAA